MHQEDTLERGAPAVLSSWRDAVYLDFEDAKALQREMFRLLKTYLQKRGTQRYIVRLGMVPLEEAPGQVLTKPQVRRRRQGCHSADERRWRSKRT